MPSFVPQARRLAALTLALTLAGAAGAQAQTVVTSTIAPVSLDDPGTYPTQETIGTFTFSVPADALLTGVTISGLFGNNVFSPNTAPGVFTLGGVDVFTCNAGDPCWGSSTETSWSYTFTAADLANLGSLDGGNVVFAVTQTGAGDIQTDFTTLTLDYIPEPGSLAVFASALLGMGLVIRRVRA
jgi:hypothetical protein